MKVLLISPNKEKRFGPLPPIGLLCIAAAARESGHRVKLLDLCFHEDMHQAVRGALGDFQPDVIGISIRNIDNTLHLAPVFFIPMVKEVVEECRGYSDAPVILGGSGFTLLPEPVMRFCNVQLGIVGEGEIAFCRLLRALETGEDAAGIPGIALLREGDFYLAPPQRISMLDDLPTPAWELIDPGYYSSRDPAPVGNIETKRGCPFHCAYCTYPSIQGRQVRLRSPAKAAAEMKSLRREYGFQYIEIVDNIFNYPVEHARAVCGELIEQPDKPAWGCCLHPGYVTGDLLKLMVRAGCRRVEFGADTASGKMLQNLSKGFGLDLLYWALALCKDAELDFGCYILLGGPGEDMDTVEETIANLEKFAPPAVYWMYGIRVYPGTGIWETARCEEVITGREDLLEPTYYLSGAMDEAVFNRVKECVRSHPNWILMGRGARPPRE